MTPMILFDNSKARMVLAAGRMYGSMVLCCCGVLVDVEEIMRKKQFHIPTRV
jgi:hypothetical protein